MKIHNQKMIEIDKLKPYDKNARTHSSEQIAQIMQSIKEFGFTNPLIIDSDFNLIAGHGRLEAIKALNRVDFKDKPILQVPCVICEGLSETQKKALILADNKIALNAGWDEVILARELKELDECGFDLDLTGFSEIEIDEILGIYNASNEEIKNSGKLVDKFIIPPTSVIDTRIGYWVERDQNLKEKLKIKSELGRGENLLKFSELINRPTSIFSPTLCEIIIKWFNIKGGSVLDCFAGGSVRGIIAEFFGFKYTGVELREEQIRANQIQARELKLSPEYIVGDSATIDILLKGREFDFVFTCPPYFNLEKYSENKNDLSNMDFESFVKKYTEIIKKTCGLLKENRFACFVIGDIRDNRGEYRRLDNITIKAFKDAGLYYYNHIILLNKIGKYSLTMGNTFNSSRKVTKVHQNILVFYKGNLKKIKEIFGDFYAEDYECHD